MKKTNKTRQPRKELSKGVLLILVLIFSVVFVFFGICIGFLINSFINFSLHDVIVNTIITLSVGIVYMSLLLALIRNKDNKKDKSSKWYINCILISVTMTFIVSAVTIFIGGQGDNIINYLIGSAMFPLIGIITTPNILKYVKKDTTNWKKIFYDNGNIHNIKKSDDYYRIHTPVSFEKEILSVVYKEQLKNFFAVIGIMVLVSVAFFHHIMMKHSYSSGIVSAYTEYRAEKAFGFIFFLMIFFLTFAIPLIAYYIANAIKKIKIVKNHEYIAFHAIVSSVRSGKISIYTKKNHYSYKYCTCVGIKEKNVHFIPATLIFIPDDVLLFPDDENHKVEKHI